VRAWLRKIRCIVFRHRQLRMMSVDKKMGTVKWACFYCGTTFVEQEGRR
jgi:hypothetical protein